MCAHAANSRSCWEIIGALRYVLGREASLLNLSKFSRGKSSLQFRLYGDHTANRYAATLKQLGIGQGVKVLRIGTTASV